MSIYWSLTQEPNAPSATSPPPAHDKTPPHATSTPASNQAPPTPTSTSSSKAPSSASSSTTAVSAFTVHPYSRGHMHITGPGIPSPLDFKTGFLGDKDGIDIKMHVWLYKTQREIVRRMGVYRGQVAACHPPFPPESKARPVDLDGELEGEIEGIKYTAEDDAVIEQ
ncbi:hypothetical protein B0T21DRAFT_417100 [Apiosordaria backusii]|uniref:Uncharacterized protein n=1 Tax=Apiosordaria backusii TaxID=314023 RepID=A0AA39ZQH7_9PEZI|nr:hypothetical protein B0T21DRAFT_417100 [Apiosordaria backusii]